MKRKQKNLVESVVDVLREDMDTSDMGNIGKVSGRGDDIVSFALQGVTDNFELTDEGVDAYAKLGKPFLKAIIDARGTRKLMRELKQAMKDDDEQEIEELSDEIAAAVTKTSPGRKLFRLMKRAGNEDAAIEYTVELVTTSALVATGNM